VRCAVCGTFRVVARSRARGDTGDAKDDLRRWDLYHAAAPVFGRLGFRAVTLKELAAACHLSASSLYYYFPSKLGLATFPLTSYRSTLRQIERRVHDATEDPRGLLIDVVDLASTQMIYAALATRLAIEAGRADIPERLWREASPQWQRVLAELISRASDIGVPRATQLAQTFLDVLAGASRSAGLRPPNAVREELLGVLRPHVMGLDADRLSKN